MMQSVDTLGNQQCCGLTAIDVNVQWNLDHRRCNVGESMHVPKLKDGSSGLGIALIHKET